MIGVGFIYYRSLRSVALSLHFGRDDKKSELRLNNN